MPLPNTISRSPETGFWGKILAFAGKIPLPVLLCLIVSAAVFPVLNNGFVRYDDAQYVLDNPALRGSWLDALSFSPGYYHPFVTLLYKAEFFLFGLNPLPYHITSFMLHLANCLSVYYLFLLLGWRREAAFLGALLFGIHPAHVEPVAWISGRKELLWGLFSFWTLSCYLKYIDTGKNIFFILSLFCFVLAVFSKPFALTLIFALPLADYYRKRALKPVLLFEKIPYLLAAFFLFLLSLIPSGFILASRGGEFNPFNSIAAAMGNLIFYLWKLILPANLSAIYSMPAWMSAPMGRSSLFFAGVLALFGAWRLLREAENVKNFARPCVFCLGFFLITLSPALFVAPPSDRYIYVPAAGLFFLCSLSLWRFYEAIRESRAPAYLSLERTLVLAVAAYCLFLGAFSFKRASVWKDTFSLCGDVLKKYPLEGIAYRVRAGAYMANGGYRQALADFGRCIELRPDDWMALANRGRVLVEIKEYDIAVADYSAAIAIKPAEARLFLDRGNANFLKGDYAAAVRDYDRALAITPAFSPAFENKRMALDKLKSK